MRILLNLPVILFAILVFTLIYLIFFKGKKPKKRKIPNYFNANPSENSIDAQSVFEFLEENDIKTDYLKNERGERSD